MKALRGDLSVKDPSEVEREGADGLSRDTDSGCAFHKYADDDLAGDLGRISPIGLGGIWLAVMSPPRP